MSVRSATDIAETWLPPEPRSLAVRTDTGAMATRLEAGSSPWWSRYRRIAPPQMVSTASLIVAPSWEFLMALMASRSNVRPSKTRCGETFPLKRVRGISPGVLGIFTCGCCIRRIAGTVSAMSGGNTKGCLRLLKPARVNSSTAVGIGSGFHFLAGAVTSLFGVRLCTASLISAPDTPSMAAWCILLATAKLPLGMPSMLSSPSMTVNSHSGRSRSSGRECNRAVWMQSCRQSPGAGSAMWRTWNSRSKSGSSIHHGWSSDSGTGTAR